MLIDVFANPLKVAGVTAKDPIWRVEGGKPIQCGNTNMVRQEHCWHVYTVEAICLRLGV